MASTNHHQGKKEKVSGGSEEEQKQNCTTLSTSENRLWIKVTTPFKQKLLIRKKNIQTLEISKHLETISLLKQGG